MSNPPRPFARRASSRCFPRCAGGNDNPGYKECFLGETDDIVAAADFLSKEEYVDADRIYLGGHSTGGSLVLLTAEMTDRFRAVFSFGPVEDIRGYGSEFMPFDLSNTREYELRAPCRWLHSIKKPVFIFEGTDQPGNASSLATLGRLSTNPQVRTLSVKGTNHFSILHPATRLVARKILADTGSTMNISFAENELNGLSGH